MNDARITTSTTWFVLFLALIMLLGGGGILINQQRMMRAARSEAIAKEAMLQQAQLTRVTASQALSQTTSNAGSASTHQDDVPAILRAKLTAQATAWNEANIERFMEVYWKSEQLTFSSGGKVTRGWQATIDRYRNKYPTKKEMGELTFSDLEITMLGPEAALVLGVWHLKREPTDAGGNFTLVFRKIDGDWLIIHDHTSSNAP